MAATATRFLDEFSRVVFRQWEQATAASGSTAPRFWRDAQRLQSVLQDAAAKLPRGPLKAELKRELKAHAAALATLLNALDKTQAPVEDKDVGVQDAAEGGALLNEADVERALTLHDSAALAAICAAEEEQEELEDGVDALETLAEQFAAVLARQYESKAEQHAKCGAIAKRVATMVEAIANKWIAQGSWVVDASVEDSASVKELEAVRQVLHMLVQLDAVVAVQSEASAESEVLDAPWTAFYRPEPRKSDLRVDYDTEMAAVFAWVVALAVNFPVERDAESDGSDSENEGDATSEDEEGNTSGKHTASRSLLDTLDAVPMAQLAIQRVVFAAQQRGRRAQLVGGVDRAWLVRVLTRLSVLPKPSAYRNEDEDEDAGLSSDDWRAVWDCVGVMYTHALAVPAALIEAAESDADALRAVVCVRQAALFMRTQRRQTLPAVAAAAATLARVPLPRSFSKWLVEAKRQLRARPEHEELLAAVRQLSDKLRTGSDSHSREQPTASALLGEAAVAMDKLLVMQQSYEAFLEQTTRAEKRAQAQRPAVVAGGAGEGEETLADALFFVDSAGGEAGAVPAASSKRKQKKSGKKTKQQTQAQTQTQQGKRKRHG